MSRAVSGECSSRSLMVTMIRFGVWSHLLAAVSSIVISVFFQRVGGSGGVMYVSPSGIDPHACHKTPLETPCGLPVPSSPVASKPMRSCASFRWAEGGES